LLQVLLLERHCCKTWLFVEAIYNRNNKQDCFAIAKPQAMHGSQRRS
jgi:hypothetical protein